MASAHRKNSIHERERNILVQNGKVTVSPRALDITWGADSRYWRVEETTGIAELIQVCWLEVNGSIEMKHLRPNTKYKLEFMVKMKPDAFGWDDSPVYIMVIPGKGKNCKWASANLSRITKGEQNDSPIPSNLEFVTPSSTDDDKVSFGLFEIWKGKWKGGLVIKQVVISIVST